MSNFLEGLELDLSVDDESRIIYIHDDITDELVSSVIQRIENINKKDDTTAKKLLAEFGIAEVPREPITIDIMSQGGNVGSGFALVSLIEQSKTPVHTRINGYAYSFGLTLFLAGEERLISRHAKTMYHQLSFQTEGTLQDVFESVEEADKAQEHIEKYFKERTSLPKSFFKNVRKKKQDLYLTVDDCLKYGIATKLL